MYAILRKTALIPVDGGDGVAVVPDGLPNDAFADGEAGGEHMEDCCAAVAGGGAKDASVGGDDQEAAMEDAVRGDEQDGGACQDGDRRRRRPAFPSDPWWKRPEDLKVACVQIVSWPKSSGWEKVDGRH